MDLIVKYPHSVDYEGKRYVPGESLPEDMPKKEADRLLKKGRVQVPGPAQSSDSGAEAQNKADAEIIAEMKTKISELETALAAETKARADAETKVEKQKKALEKAEARAKTAEEKLAKTTKAKGK